ncbi:MAG: hypothetical protein ACOC0A_02945, partial [Planctomycetota bacterium]
MAAYIVGMIVGSIVTIFPLIYMMNFDRCVATYSDAFDRRASHVAVGLLAVDVVGVLAGDTAHAKVVPRPAERVGDRFGREIRE